MDDRFPLSQMPDHGRPITERVICDTPEALSEAVSHLVEYDGAVVIERDGKRVAAIISEYDFELFQRLLWDKEMELDIQAADEARREMAETGLTVPWEKVKAELGL